MWGMCAMTAAPDTVTGRPEASLDFRNPLYLPIWRARHERLLKLREEPALLRAAKVYYRSHLADFINDWGVTIDPRNVERNIPAVAPFVLFTRQREWVEWAVDHWRTSRNGLMDKSRDVGASWLAVTTAAALCMFERNLVIGMGSRKEDLVDKSGDPSCLFYKARFFTQHVPREFRPGWDLRKHNSHMRISYPDTDSVITGEAGNGIGRGARTSIYMVDEAAWLEQPDKIDASLSMTTNCRIDMSSVNGNANSFARRRHNGSVDVFSFHWRDDPRKDDAWYAKQVATLDPITLAQEIDLNYNASVENIILPSEWVNACVDAHVKLDLLPSGERRGALDIADEGKDKNAFGVSHGILLEHVESWSGKGSDLMETTKRAFRLAELHKTNNAFRYDADGFGASVRGDAKTLNEARTEARVKTIRADPYRGSEAVLDPERKVPGTDRTNKDYYKNRKAQAWFHLRDRMRETYKAINGGPYDADMIVSISSTIKELPQLLNELSQATYKQDTVGKMLVDKQPDGTLSPNLADVAVILYAPTRPPMRVAHSVLERLAHAGKVV